MRSEAKNRQRLRKDAERRERSDWAKSDLRYWQDVVYRPEYRHKGSIEQSEFFVVRIGHEGRRTTFPLGTSNKAAAALKAREIYHVILANGWAAALGQFKKNVKPSCPLTVGEYLAEAKKHLDVRPRTFGGYARAFRKIVSDIFGLDPGRAKFDYQTGGRDAWLGDVDAVRLAAITPEKIQQWRADFLGRAKGDTLKLRSARVSADSFIREAKALFSKEVLEHVRLQGIERLPFDGISAGERVSMRYRSQIGDIEALIADACRELDTPENRDCFKAFLLASLAGLRRSEIDLLEWSAFDFDRGLLSIGVTKYFQGKNEASLGDIPLDPELSALFGALRAKANGEFVIESTSAPKLNQAYSRYRCQRTFERLVEWLRAKGIKSNSPLHVLRKEFGSAMAQKYGIFAASRALRHSSVAVTEAHYITQKRVDSIGLGHLLGPPQNVIEFDAQKSLRGA